MEYENKTWSQKLPRHFFLYYERVAKMDNPLWSVRHLHLRFFRYRYTSKETLQLHFFFPITLDPVIKQPLFPPMPSVTSKSSVVLGKHKYTALRSNAYGNLKYASLNFKYLKVASLVVKVARCYINPSLHNYTDTQTVEGNWSSGTYCKALGVSE